MNIYWKNWCWSSNILATWHKELTHWKRPWCWERLRARGEGWDRGWDGWMSSSTSVDMSLSNCWEIVMDREAWRAAVHGLQRIRHDWATELTSLKQWDGLNDLFISSNSTTWRQSQLQSLSWPSPPDPTLSFSGFLFEYTLRFTMFIRQSERSSRMTGKARRLRVKVHSQDCSQH